MSDIEAVFDKYLNQLRKMKHKFILDVNQGQWTGEYQKFNTGVKDLETMVQNVLNAAFDSVTSVSSAVQLLEAFIILENELKNQSKNKWIRFMRCFTQSMGV